MGRPRSATVESAAQEARNVGYEPLENYPGRVDKPWRVRCVSCGGERTTRLSLIRKGRVCGHWQGIGGERKTVTTTPEQALAEMRAAGYEPKGPYPGTVNGRWESTCTRCQGTRRPCLADIRQGRRCAHTKP